MPVNVGRTLRQALVKLTGERDRLDRQIGAIGAALNALDGRPSAARAGRRKSVRKTKRRVMSKAARKAVGERMKAYWTKRRARGGSGKTTRAKKKTTAKKKATVAVEGE